jgi:hypothetical protein
MEYIDSRDIEYFSLTSSLNLYVYMAAYGLQDIFITVWLSLHKKWLNVLYTFMKINKFIYEKINAKSDPEENINTIF